MELSLLCICSDQIASIYKDRCVRIHLSAPAAAAALAPQPASISDGDDEGPSPADVAAAEAKAAAAAAKEITAALLKPAAFILADGLLEPALAAAVRQGVALGLSSKILVVGKKHLGQHRQFTPTLNLNCLSISASLWVLVWSLLVLPLCAS